MKKIALMCDSSADITKEEATTLGIHVLRMPVIIEGQEYIEEETIQDADIIQAIKDGKSIKTAQPIIGSLTGMWDELLESYDQVFYIPLAKALSGTCTTAINLSKYDKYEGKVFVLDSDFVCYPVVEMLKTAKDMFSKGYTCAEVKEKIEKEGELFAILIPESLTALKNGGRISPAAAALAGLLKIHPLLKVDHGSIDLVDKVRTLKKAYKEGIDVVLKDVNPEDYEWMIIDADNRKVSDELKVMLEEATGQPVSQQIFKAVILSHAGPGTIGFGRIRKIRYEDKK